MYLLVIAVLLHLNLYAQNEVRSMNHFATVAITKAVNQYHQQKHVGFHKYMIVTMKLMKINDTSGEFALSSIYNDDEYDDKRPTHYIRVNNELVLVKLDRCCKNDLEEYGIYKISEEIKTEALKWLFSNGFALAECVPIIIFKYKKDRINGKYYSSAFSVSEKYSF